MAIDSTESILVPQGELEGRVVAALREIGTSEASLQAAVRAMMHASRHGIDSHGVRLTEHYCKMLVGGRLNKTPELKVDRRAAGSAIVDGDDGLGHYGCLQSHGSGVRSCR